MRNAKKSLNAILIAICDASDEVTIELAPKFPGLSK